MNKYIDHDYIEEYKQHLHELEKKERAFNFFSSAVEGAYLFVVYLCALIILLSMTYGIVKLVMLL